MCPPFCLQQLISQSKADLMMQSFFQPLYSMTFLWKNGSSQNYAKQVFQINAKKNFNKWKPSLIYWQLANNLTQCRSTNMSDFYCVKFPFQHQNWKLILILVVASNFSADGFSAEDQRSVEQLDLLSKLFGYFLFGNFNNRCQLPVFA